MIGEAKVKPRKLLLKTRDLAPTSLPTSALVLVDGVSLPFTAAVPWQGKNDKSIVGMIHLDPKGRYKAPK